MAFAESTSARVAASTLSALRTLDIERQGIAALGAAFADCSPLALAFEAAVDCVHKLTGRLIVTGMGKSGHVGRKIAATLASTGTPALFVHPGEASHGDLGMICSQDAVLALSWSGETAELAHIIAYCRRFKIGLIAVTANADSALGRQADITLPMPGAEEACPNGLAPTTSTTMQLAIGDALAIALLEARGFTVREFRQFHPGGRLGAKLTFVRDVMHRGERIPSIKTGALMAEALVEMSAKGFGCVAVVDADGRLAGIVTDGDLRRRMSPDLPTVAAVEVMTRAPIAIAPDCLAGEALEVMNSRKINALVVVDADRRLCGVVHLHDLLRIGVA